MLPVEPKPAPTIVFVRYMATFQRFFTAVRDYTHQGDKAGMLLGGYLADALHNVPAMLWHCDPQGWFNPTSMEEWMQEFAEELWEKAAPPRLIDESRRILSPVGAIQELQLRDDLTDVSLAPLLQMRVYLDWLSDACLSMRFMRNCGSRPPTVWRDLEQAWLDKTEQAEGQATFNEVWASVLLPVPHAFVHWDSFDEEQFHIDALCIVDRLPPADRDAWVKYLKGKTK